MPIPVNMRPAGGAIRGAARAIGTVAPNAASVVSTPVVTDFIPRADGIAVATITAAGFWISPAANTDGVTVLGWNLVASVNNQAGAIRIGTNATYGNNPIKLAHSVSGYNDITIFAHLPFFLPAGYGISIDNGISDSDLYYVAGPNDAGVVDFTTLSVSNGTTITGGQNGTLIAAIWQHYYSYTMAVKDDGANTKAVFGNLYGTYSTQSSGPGPFILPKDWTFEFTSGSSYVWYKHL
jgi:hypothetical protein